MVRGCVLTVKLRSKAETERAESGPVEKALAELSTGPNAIHQGQVTLHLSIPLPLPLPLPLAPSLVPYALEDARVIITARYF